MTTQDQSEPNIGGDCDHGFPSGHNCPECEKPQNQSAPVTERWTTGRNDTEVWLEFGSRGRGYVFNKEDLGDRGCKYLELLCLDYNAAIEKLEQRYAVLKKDHDDLHDNYEFTTEQEENLRQRLQAVEQDLISWKSQWQIFGDTPESAAKALNEMYGEEVQARQTAERERDAAKSLLKEAHGRLGVFPSLSARIQSLLASSSKPETAIRVDTEVGPPQVIYLQYNGDGEPDDKSPVRDADVTWCRDRIFEHDIKYILAAMSKPSEETTDTDLGK